MPGPFDQVRPNHPYSPWNSPGRVNTLGYSSRVHETIKGLAASAARLTDAVDRLTDAEVREPAALPGWTRAHAIAHIARSIDAYLWLLALARTGVEPGPRQTGAQIGQAVEEWAARPAAELAADLADRVAVLLAAAEAMPEDRWEYLVSALAGWRHPAWYTLPEPGARSRRTMWTWPSATARPTGPPTT